jgi:hypothetical protein
MARANNQAPAENKQGSQQARQFDRRNPVFSRAANGVAANHSSSEPSTIHTQNFGHTQNDDDLQDVPPPQDPNISGMTPTEDCYTWQAGPIDGWCENDDYREYFENSRGCDGMLGVDCTDGDYDDNGGYPTAIGHSRGHHGPQGSGSEPKYPDASYPIGRIVRFI